MRECEISGFDSEDAEYVRQSAENLGSVVPAVLDALYDHPLSLPETHDCFKNQDVLHRKRSLVFWITRTIEEPHDGSYCGRTWRRLSEYTETTKCLTAR